MKRIQFSRRSLYLLPKSTEIFSLVVVDLFLLSHLEMAHFASIALNFGVGTSKSSGTGVPQNGRTSILRTYLAHGEMVVQAKEWNSWNKRDKDQPILLFHLPLGSNLGSNKIAITPTKSAFFLSWKKTAVHQNDVLAFSLQIFSLNSNFRDAVTI